MRRTTITIPDDLDAEVRDYLEQQPNSLTLSKLVQEALRAYLAKDREIEGIINPGRPHQYLRITPTKHGSGRSDISVSHDKYLAEFLLEKQPPR